MGAVKRKCSSDAIKGFLAVQNAMPNSMRNSVRWRKALSFVEQGQVFGTKRIHEQERYAIIVDWMWGTVLPRLQLMADSNGFGPEWRRMTTERTAKAARAAMKVAKRGARDTARAAWTIALEVENTPDSFWECDDRASLAVHWAVEVVCTLVVTWEMELELFETTSWAMWSHLGTGWETKKPPKTVIWKQINPAEVLERLILVGD